MCVLLRPKYGITEQRNGYRGTMRLIVRNFAQSDVGTYHCVSTNSLGKAEGTLRLYGKRKFYLFLPHSFFNQNAKTFLFLFCSWKFDEKTW